MFAVLIPRVLAEFSHMLSFLPRFYGRDRGFIGGLRNGPLFSVPSFSFLLADVGSVCLHFSGIKANTRLTLGCALNEFFLILQRRLVPLCLCFLSFLVIFSKTFFSPFVSSTESHSSWWRICSLNVGSQVLLDVRCSARLIFRLVLLCVFVQSCPAKCGLFVIFL